MFKKQNKQKQMIKGETMYLMQAAPTSIRGKIIDYPVGLAWFWSSLFEIKKTKLSSLWDTIAAETQKKTRGKNKRKDWVRMSEWAESKRELGGREEERRRGGTTTRNEQVCRRKRWGTSLFFSSSSFPLHV